jgi:hypothetical protein
VLINNEKLEPSLSVGIVAPVAGVMASRRVLSRFPDAEQSRSLKVGLPHRCGVWIASGRFYCTCISSVMGVNGIKVAKLEAQFFDCDVMLYQTCAH